jgi:hypothetical protein
VISRLRVTELNRELSNLRSEFFGVSQPGLATNEARRGRRGSVTALSNKMADSALAQREAQGAGEVVDGALFSMGLSVAADFSLQFDGVLAVLPAFAFVIVRLACVGR